MSWEQRGGSGWYYTRSRRQGGKLIREYIGAGPSADVASKIDRAAQAKRAAIRAAFFDECRTVRTASEQTREASAAARSNLLSGMAALGFQLHSRGEWRRTRVVKKAATPGKKQAQSGESIQEAMIKGSSEEAPTVDELRRFLHGGNVVEVSPDPGNLSWQAEVAWIGLITGANDDFRTALVKSLEEFKASLRGDGSALERVLVDQCGIAWLEGNYFSARAAETANGDLSSQHRRFLLESADRAHRRLALLIKQIGTVRELLRRAGSARATPVIPMAKAPAKGKLARD